MLVWSAFNVRCVKLCWSVWRHTKPYDAFNYMSWINNKLAHFIHECIIDFTLLGNFLIYDDISKVSWGFEIQFIELRWKQCMSDVSKTLYFTSISFPKKWTQGSVLIVYLKIQFYNLFLLVYLDSYVWLKISLVLV